MVTSMDKLNDVLVRALVEYNETNAAMELVLFDDAMKHIARIVRVVMNSGGHALLVGVGGSGKQSLSRLAAFICGKTIHTVHPIRTLPPIHTIPNYTTLYHTIPHYTTLYTIPH